MQGQEAGSQRHLIEAVLSQVKELMSEALGAIVKVEQVGWIEMRWDLPDLTVTWSPGNSNRNLHAWLDGSWPVYTLRFEGAAWQDDEEKLERRVAFFPGPTGSVTVRGSFDRPIITILERERLHDGVKKLVVEVNYASMEPQHTHLHTLPRLPGTHPSLPRT